MVLPHAFEVVIEFVLEGLLESIGPSKALVNQLLQKVKSFSCEPELLALSFDLCLCGEKTHSGRKAPDCPDIAFYGPHQLAGLHFPRTVTGGTATNWQPSKNLGMRVSNH
jgi:hypothetical protein